jgi:hypothetical protein
MFDASSEAHPPQRRPEFGEQVARRAQPCTPRELFCALYVDPEDNVHYLEPAFDLALSLLSSVELPALSGGPDALCAELVQWARGSLVSFEGPPQSSSWPVRILREYAPLGLVDGAWLRGFSQANWVETDVGMLVLKQLMTRFGDPGSSEAYVQRYAALLKSVGVPPDSISRWEWTEAQPCTGVSYEHALLGLCLGFFPSALGLEALGYNLWMTSVGPCPLLERLAEGLRRRGACLRYLDQHPAQTFTELARRAVDLAVRQAGEGAAEAAQRVARGFAAAQRSYQRWESAMLGRNIPLTPRQFVTEAVKRKVRFAAEHHRDICLAKKNVGELMLGGDDAHEMLLDRMAASNLIRRGCPQESRFMTHSLSIEGPMFDAFTPAEKVDLEEWIVALGSPEGDRRTRLEPVETIGQYTAPAEPNSLEEFALARFADATNNELYYYFANSDMFPAIGVFARHFVGTILDRLSQALDTDERLNSMAPPPYSERVVAELVAEQHEKNVRARETKKPAPKPESEKDGPDYKAAENIGAIFDGCWLQGFMDVRRADFEEYGWLFRIYASEHGDGEMTFNHSRIFRLEFANLGPDVMLPKTERRLYDLFEVAIGSAATFGIALNTRRFMPEILGLNLGIEASGVGGEYLERWKRAEGKGLTYEALAARLHNSIDNYADGHTKWSLSAVQSYMRRVKDGTPSQMASQWHRIWRLWRLQDLLTHGTESEQAALAERINLRSLAPT